MSEAPIAIIIILKLLDYKFPMSKFVKGNNSKKKTETLFLEVSPGNQLIIFYQLTNLKLLIAVVLETSLLQVFNG